MILLDASKGYMVETEMHKLKTRGNLLSAISKKIRREVTFMYGWVQLYAGHSSHVFRGQAGGQTTTELDSDRKCFTNERMKCCSESAARPTLSTPPCPHGRDSSWKVLIKLLFRVSIINATNLRKTSSFRLEKSCIEDKTQKL